MSDYQDLVKRFERFAEKADGDKCWKWVGPTLKKDGRGVASINHRNVTAPRLSWFVRHGCWPDAGLFVCHSCDNPNCVNPDHLWLGSNSDNLKDAAAKRRLYVQRTTEHIQGSKHGNAKLTEEIVVSIREEYAKGGITIREIAKKYGMSYMPVQTIIARKAWKHVA